MKIQCCLCDAIEEIDSNSLLAKRYINHPLKTHLCQSCNHRIKEATLSRLSKQSNKNDVTTQTNEYMNR